MKRTLKKLMALFCCIAITMTMLPAVPVMAADTVTEISGSGVAMTAGSYKLTGETTLDGKQTLTGDLTIDLNGQTLKGTAAPYFAVPAGVTLTIRDSSGTAANEYTDGTGKVQGLTSGGSIYGMINLTGAGTFNLEGGTLTGHVSTGMAGAVRMNNNTESVFNMSGGVITGNTCITQASAVMIYNNTMNLSGGKIYNNSSTGYGNSGRNGAGIYVSTAPGTLNITGGEISGHTDTGADGKYSCDIHNRGTVNISGGVVGSDDASVASVLGIYNYDATAVLNISKDAKVRATGVGGNVTKITIGDLTQNAEIHSKVQLTGDSTVAETQGEDGVYVYTYLAGSEPDGDTLDGATLAAGGEYTLTKDLVLDGKVVMTADLTLDLAGYTITGSTAPYFQVTSDTKLTLKDSSAGQTGKLDGSGLTDSAAYGLVWVSGTTGEFELAGGTISGHTTSVNGGGVYNNGTFTMSGGVIENNTISNSATTIMYGAGVYNNGTFTMSGGEIRNNTALGKTYEYGVAVYVGAGKTFTMSGGTISGNKATNDGRGAVYLAGTDSVFTMTSGTISGNTVKFTHGAAVMARAGSTFRMQGGTITGNSVSNNGGAVYGYSTTTIEMTGGTISGNTATNNGQNIITYGPTTISGGTLGGDGDKDAIYRIDSAAALTISGAPVIGGGGIANAASLVTLGNLTAGARINSKVQLTGDSTVMESGDADSGYVYMYLQTLSGSVTASDLAAGGAYKLTGDVTLSGKVTLTGDLTLDLNGCTLSGPAVPYFTVPDGTALTVKDSSDGKTGALVGIGGETGANLGGSNYQGVVLITSGGVYNMYDITMRDHHSGIVYNADGSVKNNYNAGAVRVNSGGTFNMYSGTISGNIAPGSAGAVLLNSGGTFNMSGGTITGNRSGSTGGGVWVQGTMNMTGGTITGNSSDSTGDDIYVRNDGVLNISGVSVIADVYLQSTAALVAISQLEEGASISANKELTDLDTSVTYSVTDSVYTYTWLDPESVSGDLQGSLGQDAFTLPQEYTLVGDVELSAAITLGEGEFTIDLAGYTLTGVKGPYFTVPAGTTLTIKDSSTDGTGKVQGRTDSAAGYKGTFHLTGGTLNVYGGTYTGQVSTSNIGVARVEGAGSVLNMYGGSFSGNSGKNIGAVAVYADTTFNMYGGTITGNAATTTNGGGVYVYKGGTLNIYGGTISGNTAKGSGQNIYSYGPVTVTGGTVGAAGDKDAVYLYNSDSSLIVTGDAVIAGGGIINGFSRVHLGALQTGASVVSAGQLDYGSDLTVTETENEGVYTYTGQALPALEGAEVLAADTVFTAGKVYVMTSDVALASKVTLGEGEYTIYLDGYTLTAPAAPYFTILAGATLNIYDRTNDFGKVKGLASGGDEMLVVSGELNLFGGDLTGHTNTASGSGDGGAVKVNGGGVFTMTGGRVTNNSAGTGRGGAVNVVGGGTFILSGGTISGNTAQYGGVLYANGSHSGHEVTDPVTVKVSGGTVTGNIATTGGSALYINDGTFEMTGGNISGNIVKGTGAAHYRSTIRLGGVAATITGGIIADEAADSTAVNAVLVGDNGTGDNAVYSSLALSGKPVITGTGINKYGTAAETVVTVADLEPGAEIVSQGQLTFDPEDENVEEYKDADGLWHYVQVRPLRVLSIGNSYSRDSFYYLTRLSLAVGQPIEAAYLYKGSCTIREHANYLAINDSPSNDDSETDGVANDPSVVYSYYKADMDAGSASYGDLKYLDKVNAAHALADGEWDIIMLHQGTTAAGFAGTYNSDIDYLVDAIKAAQPNTKLYWNMIWAFDDDSTGRLTNSDRKTALATYYNNDQATMYNAILSCTADNFIGADAVYADDFEGWFPVGTAIQTMRGHFGDNLTRDGYHLSLGGGRMTAAMTILKVLRPEADLSLITAEEIAPYLDTTDDRLTSDVESFTDVFTGSEEQLAQMRAAVEQATADLEVAPAKLAVTAPVTVEQATGNAHETVAQTTAPMKLHFPDVARLADGTVIVGAYENVYHTPTTDSTETAYNGFGSEGAGRLIIWTGDETGSTWNFDEPLLIIDQKKLEEWGVVSLYDRYAKLKSGKLKADTYINYSDPRDPNVTVTNLDMDGDGTKEEVLLLTFWTRNFQAGKYTSAGTYMTWSVDGGETWAKAQKVTARTRLKRGDMAVFDDGVLLMPAYGSGTATAHTLCWDVAGQKWVEEATSTIAFAQYNETTGTWSEGKNPTNEFWHTVESGRDGTYYNIDEVALVAPNPGGDVVYAFVRESGVVMRSNDRGASWEKIANEDNADTDEKYTTIHQPGFAIIDSNRVYATWARVGSPRNTIGKVFEVNNANGWTATTATTLYSMSQSYTGGTGTVTGMRDAGDPSAELLADGTTVFVVSYDTAYRAIVGTRVTVDEAQSLSGSVSAGKLTDGGSFTVDGSTTLSGTVNVTADSYLTIDLAGGTFTGSIAVPAGATLVIDDSSADKDGVFNGTLSGAGTIIVSGGCYTQDPTDWLAGDNAYAVTQVGGKYQVKPGLVSHGEFIDFGSSLDMGLYLQGSNSFNGTGYTVTTSDGAADLTVKNGMLFLSAQGIAAKEMRDTITYEVKKGDTVYYEGEMSVYDVVKGWYDDPDNTVDKTMLADMLNYGAEAHKVFRGTEVADARLPGSDNEITWTATSGAGVSDNAYADKVAYTLSLEDKIELNIYINAESAQVSDVKLDGEAYTEYDVSEVTNTSGTRTITRVTFDEINVVDAQKAVTFTVKLSETESFTVTYSIKDYVLSTLNGGQSAVVKALQRYVESVSAYIAANS
ncbi:MAG: DUF4886 domain-containing protein [Oscillospiraceae bacterium]|nr:DUF4886 domain-containing protein [Oscillospiraceae bacterium]